MSLALPIDLAASHLRVVSLGVARRRIALRALAVFALGIGLVLVATQTIPFEWIALLYLGAFAILIERGWTIRAWLTKRSLDRSLMTALEARANGDFDVALQTYDHVAARTAYGAPGYQVVAVLGVASTLLALGELDQGRAIIRALVTGGWTAMRRSRTIATAVELHAAFCVILEGQDGMELLARARTTSPKLVERAHVVRLLAAWRARDQAALAAAVESVLECDDPPATLRTGLLVGAFAAHDLGRTDLEARLREALSAMPGEHVPAQRVLELRRDLASIEPFRRYVEEFASSQSTQETP